MKSRAVKKQKTKKPEAKNGLHGINIVWGEWLFEGPDKNKRTLTLN
ncbi:hypothetical protein [Pectobacterium carotovorum]|nr:hypothetical protein [Pectobacterium carotovorum]MBA0177158.1 hypothetical protein [Pectobacterium carotovorum]